MCSHDCAVCLNVEGVVEFKSVHSEDNPDEVAESLSAYGRGRLVAGIENVDKHQYPRCVECLYTVMKRLV